MDSGEEIDLVKAYRDCKKTFNKSQIETRREETTNQQKSTNMDFYNENPIIITYENYPIIVDTSCKNILETSTNLEEKLLESEKKCQVKEREELDQKPLLQEKVD
ncbi:hypothetical protein C2G38_2029694 [Gigaspora rosea]|uniref:Uncharacterized protein n=1 Tax=Gigaspora rosea TaxID=44941 RepID=A0A397VYV4_9GLOM|nr:hypothetical protein C2G38_2029694 [Gigaspora rosea]